MHPAFIPSRPLLLLTLGAAAGIALAASGLIAHTGSRSAALPSGGVAVVNGAVIRTDDYERALAGVASDRRDGLDTRYRRLVLDRLIEEELLVQRALELGLARHDRRVRADLTASMIASIVADTEDRRPGEAEIQAFYDQHRDFFTQPGRLQVRQIFFRIAEPEAAPTALAQAAEAVRRLRADEPFDAVRAALGDREVSPLPDTLLPPSKLVDYLGPTVLQAVLALQVGETSEPIRSGTGMHVLQVVERQGDVTPPFEDIKSQVAAEVRRRAGEQALKAYLADLRARAQITVDPQIQ